MTGEKSDTHLLETKQVRDYLFGTMKGGNVAWLAVLGLTAL